MDDTLKMEIMSESRREEWDAYLAGKDLAIAWQGYEWHDVLQKHYPHDFMPLIASLDGRICGVLPLYRLLDTGAPPRLISVPFAVAGGIVADSPEIEKRLLAEAAVLTKEHGAASIVLKQYKHKVAGDLWTDETYHNRELALGRGLEAIWGNLADVNRTMIEEAKNDGLTFEYPSRNLDDFYSVLFSFHHRQGIPCVSKKWIEDLVHSSLYSCALVRRQGRTVAGTLVKTYKKTVSFPFTAVKGTGQANRRAAYWLYWELISHHARAGVEIFHSGRIPEDESVPDFRLGWNGEKFGYYYQYYPNVPRSGESSRKRGLKRRVFSRLWRWLPAPLVRALGPPLVRRFP